MLSSIFQMPLATQTYGSQMLQSGKGKDWFIARIFQLLSWDMGAIFELQQLKILEHRHNTAWTHSTYFCIKDLQIINRRFTMFVFSTRFLYFSRQKINLPCINKQYFVTSSAHVLTTSVNIGSQRFRFCLRTINSGYIYARHDRP